MLAPRRLPPHFERWNRQQKLDFALSLYGIALRRTGVVRILALRPRVARLCGPFLWQPNSATRLFEYPWAHQTIASLGRTLRVVEVGGGLSGMQWVLASDGHQVINVDPGLAAAGKGWSLNPNLHHRLSSAFGGAVDLRPATIGAAGIPDHSVDVLLSISTLEHMTREDVTEFCRHARRVIRDDGLAIISIDLFLDLAPFTNKASNRYGRNVDVRGLLDDAGLELAAGTPSELFGFPAFATEAIQAHAGDYLRGRYPAFAQCLVARPAPRPGRQG
jgi:hypothetical protein